MPILELGLALVFLFIAIGTFYVLMRRAQAKQFEKLARRQPEDAATQFSASDTTKKPVMDLSASGSPPVREKPGVTDMLRTYGPTSTVPLDTGTQRVVRERLEKLGYESKSDVAQTKEPDAEDLFVIGNDADLHDNTHTEALPSTVLVPSDELDMLTIMDEVQHSVGKKE